MLRTLLVAATLASPSVPLQDDLPALSARLLGEAAGAADPKSRWIASGDERGSLKLWDLAKGEPAAALAREEKGPIAGLAFGAKGKLLAVAGGGPRVEVFDLADL